MDNVTNKAEEEKIVRDFYSRIEGKLDNMKSEVDTGEDGFTTIYFTPTDTKFAVESWLWLTDSSELS